MTTRSTVATRLDFVYACLLFIAFSAIVIPSTSHAQTDCINTLDYFIGGDKLNWKGSNGTHKLSQNFSSNLTNGWMYAIKFGNPLIWEYYTWDANWIYLRQDGYPNTYTFSNAKWLPNGTICKGWSVSSTTNQITSYDTSCNITNPAHSFPITMQYVDRWPTYNLGGTRGIVDVILIDYHYGGSQFERFFYSKEYGWVRWELWNYSTLMMDSYAVFNNNDSVTMATTTSPPKCYP